jgi:hypothetical protein
VEKDTEERIQYSHLLADEHWFAYIVEQAVHYARLDMLGRFVAQASEFLQCRAACDPTGDTVSDMIEVHKRPNVVLDIMWSRLSEIQAESDQMVRRISESNWREIRKKRFILWKSYLIVCNVIDNVYHLTRVRFCHGFYIILLEHPEKDLVKIVQIPRTLVDEFKFCIELEGI